MSIDDFDRMARKAMDEAVPSGFYDQSYELECIMQYLLQFITKEQAQTAIDAYKKDYSR